MTDIIVRETDGRITKGKAKFGLKCVTVNKTKIEYDKIASIWFPDQQADRIKQGSSIPDEWRFV